MKAVDCSHISTSSAVNSPSRRGGAPGSLARGRLVEAWAVATEVEADAGGGAGAGAGADGGVAWASRFGMPGMECRASVAEVAGAGTSAPLPARGKAFVGVGTTESSATLVAVVGDVAGELSLLFVADGLGWRRDRDLPGPSLVASD